MSRHHLAACTLTIALVHGGAHAQPAATPAPAPPDVSATAAPSADAPATSASDAAREHFQAGIVHFNAGRYREAELDFSSGYELSHKPGFLWNMAESARSAGESARAIALYRRYLAESESDAPRRDEAQAWIAELQRVQAEHEQRARLDAPVVAAHGGAAFGGERSKLTRASPDQDDSRPVYEAWWFWAGAGVLAAAGVVTAILVARDDREASPVTAPVGGLHLDWR